jgi:hypothetical protein
VKPTDSPVDDLKKRAQEAADFLKTDYGMHYLQLLSIKYNQLHQEAEAERLDASAKAFLVERAAGVKFAIDKLTENANLLREGVFREDGAFPPE